MAVFDKLTGKALEDKLTEYCEVYGEVLIGLQRESESQLSQLQDCRRRLDVQTTSVEEQKEQILLVSGGLKALQRHLSQLEGQSKVSFEELRSAVENNSTHALGAEQTKAELHDIRERVSSDRYGWHSDSALYRQVQQLKFLCLFSYLLTFAVLGAIWLLR